MEMYINQGLSNDERGWVMTVLSGIACVLGASVICVDIIVRQFPGLRDFKIQDSDTFLSASLSLSFGVMLFSALYNMLPSARRSLQEGGFTSKQAAWILIACFLGGVIGIQLVSRILHHFIPSHVVDCEHTHDEPAPENRHGHEHGHDHSHALKPAVPSRPRTSSLPGHLHREDSDWRTSPRRTSYFGVTVSTPYAPTAESEIDAQAMRQRPRPSERPSLQQRFTSTISQFTSGRDPTCECSGDCYGYSEPCGQECFKNINARGGYRAPTRLNGNIRTRSSISRNASMRGPAPINEETPLLNGISEEERQTLACRNYADEVEDGTGEYNHSGQHSSTTFTVNHDSSDLQKVSSTDVHHHHVPSNAFLSIGLQTSIAIALHKLPEGFITYATNHANPRLGVSVFLALFIHNITEGFAMALPLYLAINSRIRAMLISFVLGGLSQPIGAGVAALWFKLGDWKGEGWKPSEGVYGGMFAVTAGIMASVALQLFSESLDLTHSRTLCMVGAFSGMAILGVSSALTA